MNTLKNTCSKAAAAFFLFTVLCGFAYTGIVTGLSGILFPYQANGSILTIDGKEYGCELLGQQYTDEKYMWGRIMNLDVSTYRDQTGKPLLYAVPSNLSPAGKEYETLVAQRVDRLKKSNPGMEGTPIPVDLVTCSGSGLDPSVSPAAAEYQVSRIAAARRISEQTVRDAIEKCTTGRFLGIFGEKTVNVLKVNLTLDGILK